jgi:hypothetical protein
MAKTLSQDQAGAAQPATRADRLQPSASPEDWLRRIVELRHAGRNAQADDELARFRVVFPNTKIPDEALR